MSVREEIRQLVSLGPLPASASADESRLQTYEDLLKQISRPVTDEEARALTRLFDLMIASVLPGRSCI
jgi:hypothetical protein